MLDQYLAINAFHFMLVFSRLSVVFLMLPGLSAGYVPMRIRLILALLITIIMLPMVQQYLPPQTTIPAELVWLIASEVLIGAFIGTLLQVIMSALEIAGEMIAQSTGLTNALVDDPISEEQSALMIGFLNLIAVTMIFVTGVYQVMLLAIVDSYSLLIPSGDIFASDMLNMAATLLNTSFSIGVRLAAPLIVFQLVFQVTSGVLSRLSPQLNVFFVGLPAQILVGLTILMIALPAIMLTFMNYMDNSLHSLLTPN